MHFRCQVEKASGKKPKKRPKHAPANIIDSVTEYRCSLIWRGLGDMVRREAVKTNDGEAMIRHWRYDLPEFFKLGHTKYTILAHRLLSNIHSTASDKIRHDLIWNRTINVSGGPRANMPADQHMEHLNREYKCKNL